MRTVSIPAGRSGRPALPRKLLALAGDERLVEQIRRGNERAFEVAYERHNRGILSFCRHMLGSQQEAEDAVQHTFAAAYRDLLRDEREIRLKPWLYTIARNRCLSVLRARREGGGDQLEPVTAGLQDQVQQRAELRELLGDLRDLPADQRAALVLSELRDLSHAEVADVLGCEVAKVKALVFRARSALMDRRQARETPCSEIREQLANLRGGALRRSELRHHLRDCPGCRAFRAEVRRQRSMIAAILPVTPSLGLKSSVLAAAGIGGGSAGGGLAALGAAATAPLGSAAIAKVAVVGLLAGGGALAGEAALDGGDPAPAPAAKEQPAPAPPSRPAERRPDLADKPGRADRRAQSTPVKRRTRGARGRRAQPRRAPRRPDSPGSRGIGRERRSPAAQGAPAHGAPSLTAPGRQPSTRQAPTTPTVPERPLAAPPKPESPQLEAPGKK